MMAEAKTRPTGESVTAYVEGISDEQKREDARTLVEMMREATGAEPVMWGPSIVGFGSYRYRYASGREGEFFLTGFAPRKSDLTLYIMPGFAEYGELLENLGRHRTGRSCLYIKRLADVDRATLEELVRRSVEHMVASHETGSVTAGCGGSGS